ncbi:OHCU decarboxylase [Providencia rettgeri DSM 1131]|nr:2-oxo-4-hydroxy-4-carboxy-5-ureidoimidazoline decarboxylase [Providencia rettgeri]EFE53378.1 OHCU decarboxylase [Providencia rettgeri DSM 1131]BBV03699.1 uricase [Providencia rettgeri]
MPLISLKLKSTLPLYKGIDMKLIKCALISLPLLLSAHYVTASQVYNIDEVNKMSVNDYEKTFSNIFEDTTWPIVESASKRPFTGFVNMYIDLVNVVEKSGAEKQLELIKSHPQLACKNLRNNNIAALSQGEQSGAGLNECTEEEAKELAKLNKEYNEKFGFPFLLAVKKATKQQIFSSLKTRINNTRDLEFKIALQQEYKIVLFRLLDTVQ